MEPERRYSDMAPGIEQVIRAGDTLVMKDNDDNEFAVTAREGDEVMEFLKAFDKWRSAKNAGISGVTLDAAAYEVEQMFLRLPLRVQHQLPSWAKLGAVIQGHTHATDTTSAA